VTLANPRCPALPMRDLGQAMISFIAALSQHPRRFAVPGSSRYESPGRSAYINASMVLVGVAT
jgi:hypothetical protein